MKRLTLLLLFITLICLGCKLSSIFGGAGSGSGGTSSGSSSGGSDPKADVIAASKKLIALPAFSAKMDGMGQTEIKTQVDYVAPDRFHITYLGGTAAGTEMIMVGGQSFMKTGSKWSKMPGDSSASTPTLRDSFTDEGLKSLADVKFDGADTVNDKPALAYSYDNVTPKGAFPFHAKIWVSKDTGIPLKVYITYSNSTLKEMTVNYDTGSPVTIEPPSV